LDFCINTFTIEMEYSDLFEKYQAILAYGSSEESMMRIESTKIALSR